MIIGKLAQVSDNLPFNHFEVFAHFTWREQLAF
jgi:hypothetical protein